MKKLLLLMTLFAGMMSVASAQLCPVDSSHFTAGTVVYPPSLPCITQGAAYSGTVTIRIPDSLDASIFFSALPPNTYYVQVDSVRLDSITGAPYGISVASSLGVSTWLHPGQYGCLQFSGTTTAAIGSYPLSVYGAGCVHGTVGGFPVDSCQTGLLPPFVNFSLNVCAASSLCTPDTSHFASGSNIYPTSLPCITPGSTYSGDVSIRVPDSVDAALFYSGLPGGTYFVHIDSIRLDSIVGMPAGISAVSNPGDSVWLHGGQYACAQFSGITHVAPGNFPIDVYGRGCVHGTFPIIGTIDTCISRNIGNFFTFSLNVCSGPACTVDTTQFSASVHVYPPVLQCIITNRPYSGQINIQVPDSLDISDVIQISGFTIPPGAGFIHIDSIDITSITGDPTGITSISNPVLGTWLQPSSFACAVFSGTVNAATTSAGAYPLTISGTACGYTHTTLHVGGVSLPINIDTCLQNFNFSKSFPYTLNVCYPAGIQQVTEGIDLNIYPNPNQGNFTVSIASSDRVNGTLTVLDQLGRTIKTQSIDMSGSREIPLSLGNVSPGAYLLMITTSESRSVKQFIVR